MLTQPLLDRFTEETSVAVMVRAMLAKVWYDDKIGEIFRNNVVQQREDHVLFSTVVNHLHLAAYPPAAIIAYAPALIRFNVLSLVRASVEVVQGKGIAGAMSIYQMAELAQQIR